MANVLGELFSDIATSIRGGLGDIGTMKPNTFPDRIDDIVAMLKNAGNGEGGNGGSGESGTGGSGSIGNLKFTEGSFFADANRNRATITHGMDTMPDFILVQIAGVYMGETSEYVEESPLEFAWGFKSTFPLNFYCAYGVPALSLPVDTFGIDNVPSTSRDSGYIYCPNETTFQVGAVNKNKGMLSNKSGIAYRWLAVSGLGAAEPVLQDKTITENGTYTADEGFDGLGEVTVEIPSSGGTLVAKRIKFTANDYSQIVTHGLGTIPIIAWVYPEGGVAATDKAYLLSAVGISSKIKNISDITQQYQHMMQVNTYTKSWMQGTGNTTIDETPVLRPFNNATENTITVGYSNAQLYKGYTYLLTVVGFKES